MRHFPIFALVADRRVVLAGGGETAIAKLRLLLKTEARIDVFAPAPAPEISAWAAGGRLTLRLRRISPGDVGGALFLYAAHGDAAEDARAARIGRAEGALVNIVDNLGDSDFITPAIVDRDPVVVAIGTEGAAPVLARGIKAHLEERLAPSLGRLARVGKTLRGAAEAVAPGRARRALWRDFYFRDGPAARGDAEIRERFEAAKSRALGAPRDGRVDFVGAGPGDPELMTLRARELVDRADVILHDASVTPEILELARREAILRPVAAEGPPPSAPPERVAEELVAHARRGLHVVRLASGAPGTSGRLDREISACAAAGIPHAVNPGVAVAAPAAVTGRSTTRRGAEGSTRPGRRARPCYGEAAPSRAGGRPERLPRGRPVTRGPGGGVAEIASRTSGRPVPAARDALSTTAKGPSGPAVQLNRAAPLPAAELRIAEDANP